MNVLITGATGFVGGALLKRIEDDHKVDLLSRSSKKPHGANTFVAELDASSDYSAALLNKNVVIHCAARVHVMRDRSSDPLEAFRSINTLPTENLALQAAKAGVARFIFISSIKVNGDETFGTPFTSSDLCNPLDDYGKSKSEAEDILLDIGQKSGMEVVIIRPPLVYGPGVKANFGALIKLVSKGFPLPFGALDSNKRSMVYIGNLVDLIAKAIKVPKILNKVYLVSDGHDLSTSELVSCIASGLNRRTLNIPIPAVFLKVCGSIIRKEDVISRLTGSLQLDIEQTKVDFSWTPPYSYEFGITETANSFINRG
ncbi:SDR family oxidoreductase [Glaciecola sp. 33A]|jgi:UDP-glucose 4-epimerase|uniref:UDP-glucose 4-epimerase family protein n=1 Tax=Glaciecola sp. 33A TaxID=2057807 RepID=UPI000C321B36|nr:SDR family oxidoreductase [Glaciecola sp. 33A]PKI02281.1 UDP-glucose 4-epimerase [Glaciecola sp. 33A]